MRLKNPPVAREIDEVPGVFVELVPSKLAFAREIPVPPETVPDRTRRVGVASEPDPVPA